jgi:hypothetical protein
MSKSLRMHASDANELRSAIVDAIRKHPNVNAGVALAVLASISLMTRPVRSSERNKGSMP